MQPLLDKRRQDLKEKARQFAASATSPPAMDGPESDAFSRATWDALAGYGLFGALVPEQYGGVGMDAMDAVAVLEGLGAGMADKGVLFSANAHIWAGQIPILVFGTEQQKERFLPKLATGEWIAAHAMTEPDGGSSPYEMQTRFEERDGRTTVTGHKCFVTNAPVADVLIAYACHNRTGTFNDVSCLLLEATRAGIEAGPIQKKMGLRTSPLGDVIFEECEIEASDFLGRRKNGAAVFQESMEWERTFLPATYIGAMETIVTKCRDYVRARKMGGRSIGQHQSVAHKIVDMHIRVEAARGLLYRAAEAKGAGKSIPKESSMSKVFLSEAYVTTCRDALQIFGGFGYMRESGIEGELRDALASTIHSGTSEVNRNIVARGLRI